MAFMLNPYDAVLDLSNKDDRKLFSDACKGLKEENVFDRKKENHMSVVKLVEREFKSIRVIESLEISKEWFEGSSLIEDHKKVKTTIDAFKTNKVKKEEVEAHCNLV